MNTTTLSVARKIGFALCAALLTAQTGCLLPGQHGGPPGLPGLPPLPGLPRGQRTTTPEVFDLATANEVSEQNRSPQSYQNSTSSIVSPTTGISHEQKP